MRASRGVRPPFFRLQWPQQQTTLSHEVLPPCERGTTWSRVASFWERCFEQYWHWYPSRASTLVRQSGGLLRPSETNLRSLTTAGALIATETEWMQWSYSSTISTFPRNTMVTARCQLMTRKGSKLALRSKTDRNAVSKAASWPRLTPLLRLSQVQPLSRKQLLENPAIFYRFEGFQKPSTSKKPSVSTRLRQL